MTLSRKTFLGSISWILSVQYFITEAVVQYAWNIHSGLNGAYSMRFNYISDLGASTCLYFPINSPMFVCSPLHLLMNISFIISGILAINGVVLLTSYFKRSSEMGVRFRIVGLFMIAAGSLGYLVVGLIPENINLTIHGIGAGLLFLLTNTGLVLLGIGIVKSGRLRKRAFYTIISGIIALFALILIISSHYHSLGIGLIERLVAYPLTVWFVVMGFLVLKEQHNRYLSTVRT